MRRNRRLHEPTSEALVVNPPDATATTVQDSETEAKRWLLRRRLQLVDRDLSTGNGVKRHPTTPEEGHA